MEPIGSGGKRLSGVTTQGNPWLRAILGEVTWAIAHTTGNSWSAPFHCLARRRGKQKAAMALSQSGLVILSQMLRDHPPPLTLALIPSTSWTASAVSVTTSTGCSCSGTP